MSTGSAAAGAPAAAMAKGVLVATCLSTLVVNANTSALSILLPAISSDTATSVDTLQWAVTGYSLMGAAVIVTSGSLGDVFGRRRIFQFGLVLFVASCVFIALSSTGGMVILGRVIQGAAGATILACGLSLLSVKCPRPGEAPQAGRHHARELRAATSAEAQSGAARQTLGHGRW